MVMLHVPPSDQRHPRQPLSVTIKSLRQIISVCSKT